MRVRPVCAAISLTSLFASGLPGAEPAPVSVVVENRTLHGIDSRLFGQFMERWHGKEPGPEAAWDAGQGRLMPEVVDFIESMNVPVARFPGGTYLEHGPPWTVLIDGAYDREDPARPEGRAFGFDEFLDLCERTGIEPHLVVAATRPLHEWHEEDWPRALEMAQALVAYCNAPVDAELPENLLRWARLRAENGHPEPWGVKYWQIANEPTLTFVRPLRQAGKDDAEIASFYVERMGAFIAAMKQVDPDLTIFVENWMEQWDEDIPITALIRERLGEEVDYLTYHLYQPWAIKKVIRDGEEVDPNTLTGRDYFLAAASTPAMDPETGTAHLTHGALESAREHGYDVAITEWNWNGWWQTGSEHENKPHSPHAQGMGATGMLHAFMRAGDAVKIAHQSMLVGSKWAITAIHVPEPDEDNPVYMTPTGQATGLYSNHHGDRLLATEVTGNTFYRQPYKLNEIEPKEKVAHLDIVATRADTTLFLHVINRDPEHDRPVRMTLAGFNRVPVAGRRHALVEKAGERLGRMDGSRVETTALEGIAGANPLELTAPAASVSVFVIELARP
jgi:alpha-N-arabinofuranosidase